MPLNRSIITKKRRKLNIENVSSDSMQRGFLFIDVYFKNSKFKHNFKCIKHDKIHKSTYDSIFHNKGLACCQHNGQNKFNEAFVIKECFKRNIELLEPYVKMRYSHQLKCLKHNFIGSSNLDNIINKNRGLRCCKIEKVSGSNNYGWRHDLTKQERDEIRKNRRDRNNLKWVKKVKIRDNYLCQICFQKTESKNLHAHHIYSYSKYKKIRYNLNNGVSMCSNHHKMFHSMFGIKNNTRKQFKMFLKSDGVLCR